MRVIAAIHGPDPITAILAAVRSDNWSSRSTATITRQNPLSPTHISAAGGAVMP